MITIVNYGSGNVQAIGNIFKRLNIKFRVADNPADLDAGSHLILPGVGAFDKTMQQLVDSGLKEKLDQLVLTRKVPVLGICVGMQILARDSEEGTLKGLGWIEGRVRKFDVTKFLHKPHVPHMGWNTISPRTEHPLFRNLDHRQGFYFLHSYYFSCVNPENVMCTTEYGGSFPSGVYSDNIFGMQFHPEKSHSNGIQLLKNFAEL